MGANTKIQWTDATWTPLRARVRDDAADIARARGYTSLVQVAERMVGRIGPHCEHVSPGCENCYSETNNSRCLPFNGTGLPFDRRSRDLVRSFVDERILNQPLRWCKPRRIFVCSQTDLFGEWVWDDDIERIFSVMASCPQHTFQVLTKRAKRMLEWSKNRYVRCFNCQGSGCNYDAWEGNGLQSWSAHPYPNVWLGVSVENQATADERIPTLLSTPAAVRFISAEPLLGPIDLHLPHSDEDRHCSRCGEEWPDSTLTLEPHICPPGFGARLDWVIAGGESGSSARPSHPDWFRDLREQCQAAAVAFHFKQWGEFEPWPPESQRKGIRGNAVYPDIHTGKDGPANGAPMVRTGKKGTGRLLDGRTWDEVPEVRA